MASSSSKPRGTGDISNSDASMSGPKMVEAKKDPSYYYPLYKATLRGDWEKAERFLDQNPEALKEVITHDEETVLQIAAATGKSFHFVKKLVEKMPKEALLLKDNNHDTSLNFCAMVGDVKVATILVETNPYLPYIEDREGNFPIHKAAQNAKKDMVLYLLKINRDDAKPNPLAGKPGARLLIDIIVSGFLDLALDLVQRYPHMATLKLNDGRSALQAITKKASAFPSGSRLNFWKRFIYSCVPMKLENCLNCPKGGDIENPADSAQLPMCSFFRLLRGKLFMLAPCCKQIRDKKLMHHQALQLVKCLCEKIESLNDHKAYHSHYDTPVVLAARLGVHEVVQEIVDTFPGAVWSYDKDKHRIFQVAVLNRNENVFNLSYQMSGHKWYIAQKIDDNGNNILHLAGRLAPLHKLYLVSGPALQMQREIQWFKEVEKFVRPHYKEMENSDKETPIMVFTREHKDLVLEGEKWMKETANSCTIVTSLIATVVFAAAITVPGGNNGNTGLPIYFDKTLFLVFAVSDAISLFTSTTSLLMFLSILTSRYAEQDFHYILPKRLIYGLLTLFLSITSMMVAFSFAIYLVLGERRSWIIIPVAALALLPITSFVRLQFPLLVDVISSTYGRSIFGKQSDRPFY